MQSIDPLKIFSNRAALYHNRPQYAAALHTFLETECGLNANSLAADIGSGTGYLTRVLLQCGCRVIGVEPNPEMRQVAEEIFDGNPAYTSLDGQAEHIPLEDQSVDLLGIGQALHWFDVDRARLEFLRVIKPGGWVVVVDNRSLDGGSPLMSACEQVRRKYFRDIGTAAEPPARVVRLFENCSYTKTVFPNPYTCSAQAFYDGFLSSSLAPEPGSTGFEQVKSALSLLFKQHQVDNCITILFETVVWSGILKT